MKTMTHTGKTFKGEPTEPKCMPGNACLSQDEVLRPCFFVNYQLKWFGQNQRREKKLAV
jgi:hypothetical protein